jgi:predicted phage terminase large subunit-like protein
MGTMDFSAQYLQRPIPIEGNLIKREWLRYYQAPPECQGCDFVVVSWDTAMKATELADYSVATVWHIQGDNTYLMDVVRRRFDYPDLKRASIELRNRWPGCHILIEDKGSGTSLIQDLKRDGISVIRINPESDKITRLYANQAQFESGSVHFPEKAPWLDELVSELLGFPGGRHDDQVDSITQALTWIDGKRRGWGKAVIAGPIIFTADSVYRELREQGLLRLP